MGVIKGLEPKGHIGEGDKMSMGATGGVTECVKEGDNSCLANDNQGVGGVLGAKMVGEGDGDCHNVRMATNEINGLGSGMGIAGLTSHESVNQTEATKEQAP